MRYLVILFIVYLGFITAAPVYAQNSDPCEAAKAGAARATLFAKDTLFTIALTGITKAFITDQKEHCIAFGRNDSGVVILSSISNGDATSGKIPAIENAFADLHNHPGNTAPDAGDLYGLIDINKINRNYNTRFVITAVGTVYALLIIDPSAAAAFDNKHLRQHAAFSGAQPAFPAAIVDEFREIKYGYHCTDEMALAFILEKYHAGVILLKKNSAGIFKPIVTKVVSEGDYMIFINVDCQ